MNFTFGVILTAAWTLKQTSVKDKSLATPQIILSTGTFIVWVFALESPFTTLGFYQPYMVHYY